VSSDQALKNVSVITPLNTLNVVIIISALYRMNYRDLGWECMNWIHLAQKGGLWWAVMNTVMNLEVP